MLALIAGTGNLPPTLYQYLAKRGDPPLVCALDGFMPEIAPQIIFRIEELGTFLAALKTSGITRVCMAGAVRRPDIDPTAIDELTMPLVPILRDAMTKGDDATLRAIIKIFEDHELNVIGAVELMPELLPPPGILTRAVPEQTHEDDARIGDKTLQEMGANDTGQACVVNEGLVLTREGADGTEAMLNGLASDFPMAGGNGGILFKGPKPSQDRRADLPVIGPDTATQAAAAGLSGIVIEEGGVMVLDLPAVRRRLDAEGLFLWVRAWD